MVRRRIGAQNRCSDLFGTWFSRDCTISRVESASFHKEVIDDVSGSPASLKDMKFLNLFLLGILAPHALALKYEAGMDVSQWVNDTSPFVCRLEHYITGYGTGAFIHHAGEDRQLALDGQGITFGGKEVSIQARPPKWKPGGKPSFLAQLVPTEGEVRVGEAVATDVAAELLRGMMVTFDGALKESGDQPISVYLSTVGFRQAFDDFTVCEAQLLPANFAQLERSRIQYSVGQIELDTRGKHLLDKISRYLQVDKSVQQIFIDGHTDDTGLTKDNIVLSEQRAERVYDYLLEQGVAPEMLVVRYHAEKYPVVRNTSAKNRAKNRRTTVRLSRQFEPQVEPQVEPDKPLESNLAQPRRTSDDSAPAIASNSSEEKASDS